MFFEIPRAVNFAVAPGCALRASKAGEFWCFWDPLPAGAEPATNPGAVASWTCRICRAGTADGKLRSRGIFHILRSLPTVRNARQTLTDSKNRGCLRSVDVFLNRMK